jgi:hypothetical protein
LIDAHIDGRSVLGLEPRSHPRIDPRVADRNAGLDSRALSSKRHRVSYAFPVRVFSGPPTPGVQSGGPLYPLWFRLS